MARRSVRTWLAIWGVLTLGLVGVGPAAAAGPDDVDTRWHGRGVVRVTKIVTGEGAPVHAEFEICLTGPLPGDTTRCKTLQGGDTITFHDLKPGEYSLAERDVPLGFAVSYSASEFIVLKDRFTDITVTNHYTPPEPTPEVGHVEVTKLVTGDDAPGDAEFEICLSGPLPEATVDCRTVTGGGTAAFDDLEPGTYSLAESDPPTGVDVTYSTTTIEVVPGDTATATVTNHYPPPEVASEPPPPTTALPPPPPTTSPPPPTTALPPPPPTTSPPPPTTAPPVVGPETETRLPSTGSGGGIFVASLVFAVVGAAALLAARRPTAAGR